MTSLTVARRTDPAGLRAPVALAAAFIGLALVAASQVVPWLSVFGGLHPILGFEVDGGSLAGIAIAAVVLLLVSARSGGATRLRLLAIIGSVLVIADAAYSSARIGAFVGDPGPAGALIQPSPGPGAMLIALGGVALLVAAIAAPLRAGRLSPGVGTRLVLAGTLFLTGWIHLLLVPEHAGESMPLGSGFLAAGVAQVVLAGAVLTRSRRWTYLAIVVVNVSLPFLYAYAVVVGLPFGGHDHATGGLVIGAGEAIDLPGALSAFAEVIALAIAVVLVGRPDAQAGEAHPRERPVESVVR